MPATNRIVPRGGYNNAAISFLTPQDTDNLIEVANNSTYPAAGSIYFRFDGQNSRAQTGNIANITGAGLTIGTIDTNSLTLRSNNVNRLVLNSSGHLVPSVNEATDLGSSSAYLKDVYADNFVGTVNTSGAAAGSSISDATLIDAQYYQITSGTTAQGIKPNSTVPVGATLIIRNNASSSIKLYPHDGSSSLTIDENTLSAGVAFDLPNGVTYSFTRVANTAWHVAAYNNITVNAWRTNSSDHLIPATDNTFDLGTSALRVRNGFFTAVDLVTALTVADGGTGATSAPSARTNLGAAASGANSDITRLTAVAPVTWSPTWAGGGGMSYSPTPTYSRYIELGKFILCLARVTGTTGGSASNGITFSLPLTAVSGSRGMGVAQIIDGGAYAIGTINVDGSLNNAGIIKSNASNYTLGTVTIEVAFLYEAA